MSSSTLPRWAQVFVPTKEIKVTPVIICANVLVWLIMIASGVDFLAPSTDDMRTWGGANALDVTAGDYWRLWTSNYLHYGIIHLAVNMLSLNNIGRMLEQFIGAWRFAFIYTLTGICASAVSIWWNPSALGVGASGAILGIVGILLAILTTKLIEKQARMRMLRSMAVSAGLMVLISLQANVDNAAHLGGLAGGMIAGYFIFPELKAHYYQRKTQYMGLIGACLLLAGATGWFVLNATPAKVPSIPQMMSDFSVRETAVLNAFENGQYTTAESIEENVVETYRFGLRQLDTIERMDLSDEGKVFFATYRTYYEARRKRFEYEAKVRTPGGEKFRDSARAWQAKSDSIARDL